MPKPWILLVDDDADIREAIRDALADEGYATVEAADGQVALEYLRANPAPPLILLDWNMARMNGPEFMAAIGGDAALSRIPVVLLSADTKLSEKSQSSNFVGYLGKPVNLDALFGFVTRYCGKT